MEGPCHGSGIPDRCGARHRVLRQQQRADHAHDRHNAEPHAITIANSGSDANTAATADGLAHRRGARPERFRPGRRDCADSRWCKRGPINKDRQQRRLSIRRPHVGECKSVGGCKPLRRVTERPVHRWDEHVELYAPHHRPVGRDGRKQQRLAQAALCDPDPLSPSSCSAAPRC